MWLNPPYATQLIRAFVARAIQHDGPAILLTNNATSTLWAQRLLEAGADVCCLRERVCFIDPATGQPAGSGPLQGQIVWDCASSRRRSPAPSARSGRSGSSPMLSPTPAAGRRSWGILSASSPRGR